MPDQTFEERLAQRLSTYAEDGTRRFDAYAVAQATIAGSDHPGPLGWLAIWRGPRGRTLRFALTVSLTLALLLAAMLAAGTLLPAGDPEPRSGLFLWSNGVAAFIGPSGDTTTRPAPSPREDMGCPVLVGGSGVLAQTGFGQIHLTDLVGDLGTSFIDINYAGGERWSPDHRRIALVRFDGTITVVFLDDLELRPQRTVDVPGVIDAAWSGDGQHLAVARRIDGGNSVAVDLMDVSAVPISTSQTFTLEGIDPAAWLLLWPSPDGSTIAVGLYRQTPETGTSTTESKMEVFLGDVATGVVSTSGPGDVSAAWDPDGSRVAFADRNSLTFIDTDGAVIERTTPSDSTILSPTWSPDGSRLAFTESGGLVTVDPSGHDRAELTLAKRSLPSYLWAPDGSGLYIASPDTANLKTVVQSYSPDLAPQGSPVVLPANSASWWAPVCISLSDVTVSPGGEAITR